MDGRVAFAELYTVSLCAFLQTKESGSDPISANVTSSQGHQAQPGFLKVALTMTSLFSFELSLFPSWRAYCIDSRSPVTTLGFPTSNHHPSFPNLKREIDTKVIEVNI